MSKKHQAIAGLFVLCAAATTAFAQNSGEATETYSSAPQQEEEDRPWGLLGLLGLIGLAGLKRRDKEVHVDTRTRP